MSFLAESKKRSPSLTKSDSALLRPNPTHTKLGQPLEDESDTLLSSTEDLMEGISDTDSIIVVDDQTEKSTDNTNSQVTDLIQNNNVNVFSDEPTVKETDTQ